MKRTLSMNLVLAALFWGVLNFIGAQAGEAVEEHHKSTTETAASTETGKSGSTKGHGMMGMMGEGDNEGDRGMMGRGMMSTMMGGPGGMGKMMNKMGPGMKGCPGPGSIAHMVHMLEKLNLTSDQWSQVRASARTHLDKMADLWAQRMKLRIELAALRWDEEMDKQKVKTLFVKKAEAKAEMFLTGMDYLRSLRETLTKEQLEKWDAHGF